MAKKRASGGFNMAEEIRKLLRAKRTITGREVYNALVENFPNQKIKEGSCLVSFSASRMQMGLKKKWGKKKSVAGKVVKRRKPSTAVAAVDLNALQVAAKFVAQVGSADTAIAAIKQLQSVQIR